MTILALMFLTAPAGHMGTAVSNKDSSTQGGSLTPGCEPVSILNICICQPQSGAACACQLG